MYKLSIITINYNNKEGLQKTIESVLNQTFIDFEYIIIDGGSTDGSKALLETYDDKINYWVSEKDKGIYNAMNKGILKATGDYLQFLNSGDWLLDECILSKVFNEPRNAEILYGNMNNILSNGTINLMVPLSETELTLANFNTNIRPTILHPSSFIKRSLFADGLYDENYSIIADIKFFIEKIIIKNCTVNYLPYTITNFNMDGISSNPDNWIKTVEERNRIFTEFLPPRMLKDYEVYFQVKDSSILKYIPMLEKTNNLKRLVTKLVALIVNTYKLIKTRS